MQARDALLCLAAIDWTPIVVAIITLGGTVFVALLNLYMLRQIRTPSGKAIGAQVEDAHHVSLANHYRIRALANALGEPGEPDDPATRKREALDEQ